MKPDLQHFFNKHKAECLCGGIAIVVLIANAGSIKEFIASNNQLRESLEAEQAGNDEALKETRRNRMTNQFRAR